MNKLKAIAEFDHLDIGVAGTLSTGAKQVIVAPFQCVVKALLGRVRVAGTTGAMNIDVQRNGASIFASGAAGIQFASASTTPTYGPFAAQNPAQLQKGDILTVNVTTVHTTPAIDLGLAIVLQRLRGGGPVAATVTDTLGVENEP